MLELKKIQQATEKYHSTRLVHHGRGETKLYCVLGVEQLTHSWNNTNNGFHEEGFRV